MTLGLAILLTCVAGLAGASVGTGALFALARWARRIEARGGRVYILDWLMEGKMKRRDRSHWQRTHDNLYRLARDQTGTAEGQVAAAKAAQIEAQHLRPEPQLRQRTGRRPLRGYARVAQGRDGKVAEADYDFGGVPDSCLE